MKYAVVDTGSNTIRLAVYDYENGTLTQLYNEAIFANLAGYIENNHLSEAGICAAAEAILTHKDKAAEFGCQLHVFATAAIRNAENCNEICASLFHRTSIPVDLISGDDEARLSFYGACTDFPVAKGVMADVGGGSSEVILFENKNAVSFHSVPWGGLKAFKDFVGNGLPNMEQIEAIRSAITDVLKKQPAFEGQCADTLCVVGGSVRAALTLASVFTGADALSLTVIDNMLTHITKKPDAALESIRMHAPKRATTIAPALAIYSAIGHFFGADKILLSDKGIKEGYVLKKLLVPQS